MCKTVTFTGWVITCTSVYLVTSWKINAFSWNGQWCDHVPCVLNTSKRTVWDSIQENFRKSSSLSSGTELTDFGFVGVAQSFFKPCGVHTLQKSHTDGGMSPKVFGQLLNFPRNLLHRSPRCDKKLFKAIVHYSSTPALADLGSLMYMYVYWMYADWVNVAFFWLAAALVMKGGSCMFRPRFSRCWY